MKTVFYRKILSEQTFQVKTRIHDIVQRFQHLDEINGSNDTGNNKLKFQCSPNGSFKIGSLGYSRYMIFGELLEENGKTSVKLFEVCDYSRIIIRWLILLVLALVVAFNILVLKDYFNAITGSFVVWLGVVIKTTFNERKNKVPDLETMKEEILRRIETVEKWND